MIREHPATIIATLIIKNVTESDFMRYHCNASIHNDRNRMKLLSVLLNGKFSSNFVGTQWTPSFILVKLNREIYNRRIPDMRRIHF